MTVPSTAPAPPATTDRGGVARWAGVAAVLFIGAIFGFFYAWVCSTMWGLDAADPRVAIEAMQAMNASVRNAVFAPAFFGTPVVVAVAAILMWRAGRHTAARLLAAAALIYLFGGLVPTMTVNVPMNETLASVEVPGSREAAETIWADYSGRWQMFNIARTVASGVALLLAALALSAQRPRLAG